METARDWQFRATISAQPVCCAAVSSECTFVRMADDELPDELRDELDESDLHFAAQHGDMTRVRQLLADGRSPNAFDEISKTPLHYAPRAGTSTSCECFWKPAPM